MRSRLKVAIGDAKFSQLQQYLEQDGVALALGKRLGLQSAGHEPEREADFSADVFGKEEEKDDKEGKDLSFAQIKAKVKALEDKYLQGIRVASGIPNITLDKPISQQCSIA